MKIGCVTITVFNACFTKVLFIESSALRYNNKNGMDYVFTVKMSIYINRMLTFMCIRDGIIV